MTFRSRRKRRTTVLLALTATAALSPLATAFDEGSDAGSRYERRQKTTERIQKTPTLRPASAQVRQPLVDVDPSQTRLQINIEPPNREQLFKLQTAGAIIDVKQSELSKDSRGEVLPTPGPVDRWTMPNSERLGRLWNESVLIDRGFGRAIPGVMGVVNEMGRYPFKEGVKPGPAVAVMNEYLPATDMQAAVDASLAAPGNEFGVVVRAKTPEVEVPRGAKDGDVYHLVNTGDYYAATATADRVELRRVEKGKITVLKTQALPQKTIFRLTVRALGNSLRVYRDAEEVLVAEDGAFVGHYAGVIGVKADGGPVLFDNFEARSYAGEFEPRLWAGSTRFYRGPNVHYNTLYFEQRALERHGHHLGNLFQPFIAHGLFFVDMALLPASLGRSSPGECYASDLYARPGDLVPFYTHIPQPTAKGLLYEAGVLTTIFLIAP
jgi:hypothetical protein